MMLPILLMLIVSPIGFVDVFYFHIVKFKLYKQPSSRTETVTHIIRSLLFGLGAFLLLNFEPHGLWVWVVGGLFVADFVNTLVDVFLEPKSRKPLGGIPPSEYIIHIIGAVSAGAITATYFVQAWPLHNLESVLSPVVHPLWLFIPGTGLVIGSLFLAVLEIVLLKLRAP